MQLAHQYLERAALSLVHFNPMKHSMHFAVPRKGAHKGVKGWDPRIESRVYVKSGSPVKEEEEEKLCGWESYIKQPFL